MKLIAFLTLCLLTLALAAPRLRAADPKSAEKAPTSQPAAVPINKKCPISGDDVDPKGKTVTYKGKVIGFCCDDCIEKFQKDPEKYMKDLK